jgi:CRISPR-associated protein Cmr3
MSLWLIEPRDPLIARDGKPASSGRFRTLGFPFPSTLAGAVRTRLGSGDGAFSLETAAELDALRAIPVAGPLLAELGPGDEVGGWLAPAPRDVHILAGQGRAATLLPLLPRTLPGTCDSLGERGLLPLAFDPAPLGPHPPGPPLPSPSQPPGEGGIAEESKLLWTKPVPAPAFWSWDRLEAWLTAPAVCQLDDLGALGLPDLLVERRSHLAIQPGGPPQRVGIDGMLFETAGLRFLHADEEGPREECLAPRRLALSVRCAGGTVAGRPLALQEQLAPLGGERRLARWRRSATGWPSLPAAIRDAIVAAGRARLMLLTPAFFKDGALPAWSGVPWPGLETVTATVRAACVPRPQVVSGWDLAADNRPGRAKGRAKPTRRLAASGSVYFLELHGSPADLGRWCDSVWLATVSDDEPSRRDGFGLAVLGTWIKEES